MNTHQEAVSVCDKALRNNFLPSVAVRLVAGSIHLTVGCPTSSAQGPEPKCYKPPKTCKQCLRQTNQNRILKTLLPKPCCKKQGAASCLTTKTCYFSKTPEWGQKIGTKTGRARSLPSSQECEAGCSNQRDGQAKGSDVMCVAIFFFWLLKRGSGSPSLRLRHQFRDVPFGHFTRGASRLQNLYRSLRRSIYTWAASTAKSVRLHLLTRAGIPYPILSLIELIMMNMSKPALCPPSFQMSFFIVSL